MKICIWY